jgi:DNA-binding NarL/FixJ family response regulator
MGLFESTIKPRTVALGPKPPSIALLARLARVSKTVLGDAANGMCDLGVDGTRRTDEVLRTMEEFAASIAPIRPDWSDARAVEEWLTEFRDRRARAARPKTATEIDREIVAELVCGADPIALAQRLNLSVAELSARVEAVSNKLQSQIDGVRAAL